MIDFLCLQRAVNKSAFIMFIVILTQYVQIFHIEPKVSTFMLSVVLVFKHYVQYLVNFFLCVCN